MSEWDAAADLLLAGRLDDLRSLPAMKTAIRRAEVVAKVAELVARDNGENQACHIVARREGYTVGQVRGWWFAWKESQEPSTG